MGFKEENKEIFLDPFRRFNLDFEPSLNRIGVSAEVVGNRVRLSVPKDASGNLTGTIIENMALENSTWIYEPVDDALIDERIDRYLSPRKYMDLSKFDKVRGILIEDKLEPLKIPLFPRKDYSPYAKKVLEHPNPEVRKMAIEYIDDEDILAAIILFSKKKDISLFVLDYINDISILKDIVLNRFNYYYFTGAVDIFYDLPKEKLPLKVFNEDVRKAALERIKDKKVLSELMDCDEWYKPILMIKDKGLVSKYEFEKLDLIAKNREIREIIKNSL